MKEEWLTIIIVLLMIGIALDGYRRMRISRREKLRLSKNAKKADFQGERTHSSSEFPSGGARVAAYRKDEDVKSLNSNVKKSYAAKRVTVGAPQRIPEQVTLNLEESVPMLMDSVEMENKAEREQAENNRARAQEFTTANHDDNPSTRDQVESDQMFRKESREPSIGDFDDLDEDYQDKYQFADDYDPEVDDERDTETESATGPDYDDDDEEEESSNSEADYKEPDEVLIMNLMARSGTRFKGPELLQALMDEGLKLGAMDIFHRHMDNDGDAPVLFSLANMVVPGTFNLAEMDDFETPGVSLFLSLPVEGESLSAYNDLARTARNLADKLDGELKDENRSVMTSQTIEHGRQRVIEYERKKKLARA